MTHAHTFSQPQANEQSFHYSALHGRLAERAIHWSVHLSLPCPLSLTVEINGKHPERTWTQKMHSCLSAHADCSSNLHLLWCLKKSNAIMWHGFLGDCGMPGFTWCFNLSKLCQRSTDSLVFHLSNTYLNIPLEGKLSVLKPNQLIQQINSFLMHCDNIQQTFVFTNICGAHVVNVS